MLKKIIAAVSGVLALLVLGFPLSASAATTTKVITPIDLDYTSSSPAVVRADGLNKWFLYNDTTDQVDNSLGSFVNGPATPPNGVGSIQFTLGANPNDRKNIATYQFAGTPLASITQMAFSAYSHSGVSGPNESPYLNFNVDFSGTGTSFQRRLVYVPSNNGAVPQDTWNTYDAINGGNAMWNYSGATWPVAAAGPDNGLTIAGNTPRTWTALLADFPGIRVNPADSWLGVRVGEPGPTNYVGNVDSFKIKIGSNTTTFDFEPVVGPPTSKADCKHNGWMSFNNPNFKNQGQCEKWVESDAHGNLKLANPSQQIKFNVGNNGDHHGDKNSVEYWNFDYPGGLHYTADVMCAFVDPQTNEARFMFQIPPGHPGLSDLYVVVYVKEVKHGTDLYGHAATADLATANQWCQTGVGFSPTMYTITKGNVEVDD